MCIFNWLIHRGEFTWLLPCHVWTASAPTPRHPLILRCLLEILIDFDGSGRDLTMIKNGLREPHLTEMTSPHFGVKWNIFSRAGEMLLSETKCKLSHNNVGKAELIFVPFGFNSLEEFSTWTSMSIINPSKTSSWASMPITNQSKAHYWTSTPQTSRSKAHHWIQFP